MRLKIKTALISLSDKKNLKKLLICLKRYNIKIISSGGTYGAIKKFGYECLDISNFTGFPQMLDGRIKTLHPKIHAGILSNRKNKHNRELREKNFEEIDLVITNFYPFEKTLKSTTNHKKIIENIDVGGPTMVRSSSKNYENVTVITSIEDYKNLEEELNRHKGSTSIQFRKLMAEKAFLRTCIYDAKIFNYFSKLSKNIFPDQKITISKKIEDLRYGENPHQKAAIYNINEDFRDIEQLHGKKLSYNNYNDLYSAIMIARSLPRNSGSVIVKHSNPCGVSADKNHLKSFNSALESDPISAFGGILSCNFKISTKVAKEIKKIFFEIVIATGFEKNALNILKKKKNLRIIDSSKIKLINSYSYFSVLNNLLIQSTDIKDFKRNNFTVVSKKKPSKKDMDNLIFAFNVCRYVKSNAIVISQNFSTVGIGSGQSSRVDSCKIAIDKMKKYNNFSDDLDLYAASDAFFPFTDGLEKLVLSGVKAVIQPSGSINDKKIIKFANKLGLILVFSKTRHFKH